MVRESTSGALIPKLGVRGQGPVAGLGSPIGMVARMKWWGQSWGQDRSRRLGDPMRVWGERVGRRKLWEGGEEHRPRVSSGGSGCGAVMPGG